MCFRLYALSVLRWGGGNNESLIRYLSDFTLSVGSNLLLGGQTSFNGKLNHFLEVKAK